MAWFPVLSEHSSASCSTSACLMSGGMESYATRWMDEFAELIWWTLPRGVTVTGVGHLMRKTGDGHGCDGPALDADYRLSASCN
jgi:hypothetical protein